MSTQFEHHRYTDDAEGHGVTAAFLAMGPAQMAAARDALNPAEVAEGLPESVVVDAVGVDGGELA